MDFQLDITSTGSAISSTWQYDSSLHGFLRLATNHHNVFVLLFVLLLLALLVWIGFLSTVWAFQGHGYFCKAACGSFLERHPTGCKKTSHFLDDWIVSERGQETILLIDANNVRGKRNFVGHTKLLSHLICRCQEIISNGNVVSDDQSDLMDERQSPEQPRPRLSLIYIMDHGCQPATRMMMFPLGISILLVWAGPHRTADDVVVQATRAFLRSTKTHMDATSSDVIQWIIVTSDRDLKQRCQCLVTSNSSNHSYVKHRGKNRTSHKRNARNWSVRVASSVDFWTSCLGDAEGTSLKECKHDTMETMAHEPFCKEIPFWDKLRDLEEELHAFGGLHNHQSPTSTTSPSTVVSVEQTWQRVVFAEAMRQCILSRNITCPTSVASNNSESTLSNASLFLKDFQSYYMGQQQSHSPFNVSSDILPTETTSVIETNLLADHRIGAIPNQKQRLLHYLNSSPGFPFLAMNEQDPLLEMK